MIQRLLIIAIPGIFSFWQITFAQSKAALPPKEKNTLQLKTPIGVAGQANGLKTGVIKIGVDTAIRINPKMAYISYEIANLTGSSQMDLLSGAHLFWIFDKTGKQINVPGKVLFSVKGTMGQNTVNLSVRVPFRLKSDKEIYTVHYRWESKDKSRNIDLLTTK